MSSSPPTPATPSTPSGRAGTPRATSVLISGASIAGPALAYWLDRYGFDVTVVERAPWLRPGGQPVDVRGAGLEVAERMGVAGAVRARRTGIRGVSIVDDEGAELFRSTERVATGEAVGGPDVEILRDELCEILFAAGGGADGRIEYLFGDSIAALTQDEDAVRVVFAGGARRTFDVVVGADGVHSATRRLAFGPEERCLHFLGSYLAVWTAPNDLGLDRWQVVYRRPGSGTWGGMVMSVRDNAELRVFVGMEADEPPARSARTEDHKRLVAAVYAGAGWEMPRLLERMWDAPDFHFDSLAQIRMDSWSRGRVVLLGDAGYCGSPATGQGTTLAMVGAYVLAGELKAAGGDHRAAFAAYERRLRAYVTANQDIAPANLKRLREGFTADPREEDPFAITEDFMEVYAGLSDFPLPDY
ncbi:FAD-dependent monooxygenase [Streptomyces sp. B1866]|uniref:FAD-dependent monooxygenase n=1 Tax=Streptomyces sp. B1866 TaxID=3075431 RepID=UPI00288CC259|nr:FAD-dependent monooxygenase [Streptomyces sp. B1866]MDT3396596.1 FAD-dependent monooxygenase [Streptomyces sp. B1866]